MELTDIICHFVVQTKKLDDGLPVAGSEKGVGLFKDLFDAAEFAEMKNRSAPNNIEYIVTSFNCRSTQEGSDNE